MKCPAGVPGQSVAKGSANQPALEASLTHTPSQLRDLMSRHNIHPRRSLGQNFVAEPATTRRIVELSGVAAGDHVLEIGAGLGSLTLALVETGANVTAIEADPALADALNPLLATPTKLITADATVLDYNVVLADADNWTLVANLPYNIATLLILDLLKGVPKINSFVVMVQLEVAERLCAKPGTKARGIPSVLVELYGTAEILMKVPPTVFIPRPKVESAVLRVQVATASRAR